VSLVASDSSAFGCSRPCYSNSEFKQTTIEYLGLIVSKGEIRMDLVKVAGVTEWPTPTMKKEVQSFLGFMNFYC
jgi:hypothetical protein